MPAVHPFSAWRYNPQLVGDLATVVSPPYDVITTSDREALGRRSPYHFAHFILPEGTGGGKYQNAATLLERWCDEGVLIQDSTPAIYMLEQEFKVRDRTYRRTGIVCTLSLEPLGDGVLAHEKTIPKHIADRLDLMRATRTNSGQIFMSYQDDQRRVALLHSSYARQTPGMDFMVDNVRYRIWAIHDKSAIDNIQSVLARTPAIIADGHHRYKTALKYYREHPRQPGSDRVMVTLVNAEDPGMMVLPTHRIIDSALTPAQVMASLKKDMHIRSVVNITDTLDILSGESQSFGLCYGPERKGWILTPRTPATELDVAVFHAKILKPGFHIDTQDTDDLAKLTYLRGTSDPQAFILNAAYQWLGLVRPPDLDQVFELAGRRQMMPQKSTYFFPKVYSGFLLRRF